MSNLAIITLPFLNNLLNKEDYSKDAGFVDLYTNDIDHPTYENELYLLYDDTVRTAQSMDTANKLSNLIEIKSITTRIINNKPYTIYKFWTNYKLRQLIGNCITLSAKEKIHIIKFWNEYYDIYENLLSNNILGYNSAGKIPSADYNGVYEEQIDYSLVVQF